MANASVQGLVATGPRRGCRVFRLGRTGEDANAGCTQPEHEAPAGQVI